VTAKSGRTVVEVLIFVCVFFLQGFEANTVKKDNLRNSGNKNNQE
jgi:hypothetical protein